jgi:hypothetical protein
MSGTFQPMSPGSQTIASGNFGVMPISFGYYPIEGSRCVTVQYNWSTQNSYTEDLSTALESHGIVTSIQSVYIDNSQNLNSVSITVQTTGQVIICPPQSQGIFPLLFSGAAGFTIQSSLGGVSAGGTPNQVTRLYLFNVPANSSGVWSAPPLGVLGEITQAPFAKQQINNITGTTAIQASGAGRLYTLTVTQTTAVGTISLSSGAELPGNIFFIIPIGTPQGTIYQLNWPFVNGLTATFDAGATGTICVAIGT